MNMRPSRDAVYIAKAFLTAQRGTCARRKGGCILVDAQGHELSSGYNGRPAGWPHCLDKPCKGVSELTGQGLEKCEAIHAEQNALLQCPDTQKIYTCYTTIEPCVHCVKLLLNTSCERIVFTEVYYGHHRDTWRLWVKEGRKELTQLYPLLLTNGFVVDWSPVDHTSGDVIL